MQTYLMSLTETSFNRFIRAGTLELRPFHREYPMRIGDKMFVSTKGEDIAYGPFTVIDDIPGKYAFIDSSSLLCKTDGPINKIHITPLSEVSIKLIQEPKFDDFGANFLSVTGDLELDGFISTAVIDHHFGAYCIILLSSNVALFSYYKNKLDYAEIEYYVKGTSKFFFSSRELCEKCKSLDLNEYSFCKQFLQGYLAPQIMSRKPLESAIHDAPLELQRTIVVSDSCNLSIINKIDGCGLILTNKLYGINRVSGLSVREHPFSELIHDFQHDNALYEKSLKTVGSTHYCIGASVVILKNIFRLSGYKVEIIDHNSLKVKKKDMSKNIFVLKNFEDAPMDSLNDFIERFQTDGVVIVLKNKTDGYLKITDCLTLKRKLKNTPFSEENQIIFFQNLENNVLLPVHKTIASELRHKIHMVWEV